MRRVGYERHKITTLGLTELWPFLKMGPHGTCIILFVVTPGHLILVYLVSKYIFSLSV
jgi:hypothetical protein